jgi:hypothetical protein
MGTTSSTLKEKKDLIFDSNDKSFILQQLKNGKILKNITGIKSNSASPSDTWILFFAPEVVKIDNSFLTSAFCKISISADTVRNRFKPQALALEYEMQVNDVVIKSIISNHVCNYFVRCFNVFYNCKFDDLLQILSFNENIDKTIMKTNLERNIEFIYNAWENRPAITLQDDAYFPHPLSNIPYHKLNFNIVFTETIKENSTTFTEFIELCVAQPSTMELSFWTLYLQVAIACYSLQLFKCVHNDLHTNNVFVLPHHRKIIQMIQINGLKLFLRTEYDCKLFDFDRAYALKLGENKYINLFKRFQQNNVITNIDFIKFNCFLIKSNLPQHWKNNILLCIAKHTSHIPRIKDIYTHCWLKNFINPIDFDLFLPITDIITNIISHIPDCRILPTAFDELLLLQDNISVIDETFFSNDGTLNTEKQLFTINKLKYELETFRNTQQANKRKIMNIDKPEDDDDTFIHRPLKKSRILDGRKRNKKLCKKSKQQLRKKSKQQHSSKKSKQQHSSKKSKQQHFSNHFKKAKQHSSKHKPSKLKH